MASNDPARMEDRRSQAGQNATWRRLQELAAKHDVEWRWVKGHAGIDGNERADQLANRGVESVSSSHRRL
jgi:ribonuclease HI